MKPKAYAYIDGQNIYRGMREVGWRLSYRRFRRYLEQKYGVQDAYYFRGRMPKGSGYDGLYQSLKSAGYELVFKEALRFGSGGFKGNCDAELVLHAVSDFYERPASQVVIAADDGDYACLVRFFKEKGVKVTIICTKSSRCSALLKRANVPLVFLETLSRSKIEHIPKK